jgi:DNA invertase Pin-like site-specific DNA recombinase
MPKDPTPIPAVLYAAKSTKDPNDSTGSQLRRIEERIDQLGGRAMVRSFKEDGVSGFRRSRGPELAAAIAAAKAAAAERGAAELWVFHSSRLGRGTGKMREARALGEVFYDCRRHGVTLRSVEDDTAVTEEAFIGMASTMARKYSEDISAHTRRSKDEQMKRGQRLGGPVPDGLQRHVERDPDTDRTTARRYDRDPDRAPIIERIFDLSEQGHGDGVIARALNADGLRTKGGRPWTRRRVQDTLLNPIYAGRVRRTSVNGRRLDEPEVVTATNIEPLIGAARFDRITGARAERDLASPAKHVRGGRPTTRYALAKLGVCDRCGEGLYAATSPYQRKDGTRARSYVCANVRTETGLCDQPKINAETVDRAIVSYLDGLFVDFEAWQSELRRGTESQRAAAEAELARERAQREKGVRREALVRERWLRATEGGDEREERRLAEVHASVVAARDDASARVERLEETLGTEPEPPPTDDMLDLFNELAASVRLGGGTLGELNERLRAEFQEFRLDTMPDGSVGVQPVLRPRPFDAGAAFIWWLDAGRPLPSDEEAERIVREGHIEDARWVTGDEQIRPPVKALAVPTEMGPDPQEYRCTNPKRPAFCASQA